MTFDNVTAMSIGGHSVSSVWLKGVKVWPTITTYYVPFRLVRNGSYMTWGQFQSENWDSIRLSDDMWTNEETFTKNQVGHITDGSGNTVFYLSSTNSSYSGGGYVYLLNNSEWEYTNSVLQTPATTNTLSAFNTAGINDIEGYYVGEVPEGIPIYVGDGQYTCTGYCNGPILQWSVHYIDADTGDAVYLSECLATNGTAIYTEYYDYNFSTYWGSDPSFNVFYLPYSMTDQTVRFYYSFDCHIDPDSPYNGYVDVYVSSSDTEILVQLPTLSGSV